MWKWFEVMSSAMSTRLCSYSSFSNRILVAMVISKKTGFAKGEPNSIAARIGSLSSTLLHRNSNQALILARVLKFPILGPQLLTAPHRPHADSFTPSLSPPLHPLFRQESHDHLQTQDTDPRSSLTMSQTQPQP